MPRQYAGQRPGDRQLQQTAAAAEPEWVVVVVAEFGAAGLGVGGSGDQAGIDLETGVFQQRGGVRSETVASGLIGGGLQREGSLDRTHQACELLALASDR